MARTNRLEEGFPVLLFVDYCMVCVCFWWCLPGRMNCLGYLNWRFGRDYHIYFLPFSLFCTVLQLYWNLMVFACCTTKLLWTGHAIFPMG